MKRILQVCFHLIFHLWTVQVFEADVAAVVYRSAASPRISTTVLDANLMFELLLGGVDVDRDNNIILLDQELASMRQGRAFLARVNDDIPKTLGSMEEMLNSLEAPGGRPLSHTQFDSLVLSMVYSAYCARTPGGAGDQRAWGGLLTRLANVTVKELRGQYIITLA